MTESGAPTRRWSTIGLPPTTDVVFAGTLLVLVGLPSAALPFALGSPVPVFVGVLAGLLMPVALAWRRTLPVASSVTVYAAALAHFLAGQPVILADTLIFVALYSVTVHGPRWARRAALGSALFGAAMQATWLAYTSAPSGGLATLVNAGMVFALVAAVVLSTWAVGLVRRSRVERMESLAERAARLEVERDQQARIATAAERARIAREMHDIVAHSLSVVIAQADGGRYAAAGDPAAAAHALTTISETGRAALADMRRILGVLRSDDAEAVDLLPQPDDADLESLVAQVRGTGLQVALVRMGTPRALPPGTGLTVYRITQEALTNILKHAGPGAHATVLVQWTPTHLLLQVDDDGRGAAATSDGGGHGLLGMRERATMLGGTLTAGPRPGGGFRIRTEIPLPGAAATPLTLPRPEDTAR